MYCIIYLFRKQRTVFPVYYINDVKCLCSNDINIKRSCDYES